MPPPLVIGPAKTPTPESSGGGPLSAVASHHISQLRVEVAALHAELEVGGLGVWVG